MLNTLLPSITMGIVGIIGINSLSGRRVPPCTIIDRRSMSAGRFCRGGRGGRSACGNEFIRSDAGAAWFPVALGATGWLSWCLLVPFLSLWACAAGAEGSMLATSRDRWRWSQAWLMSEAGVAEKKVALGLRRRLVLYCVFFPPPFLSGDGKAT